MIMYCGKSVTLHCYVVFLILYTYAELPKVPSLALAKEKCTVSSNNSSIIYYLF